MNNLTEETKILEAGINMMSERVTKVGVPNLGDPYELQVEVENTLDYISRVISMALQVRRRQTVSSEQINKYLRTLIVYRVQQVQGNCPVAAKDLRVPSFFMPVLTALGKFEDPARALRLTLMTKMTDVYDAGEMEELGFMLDMIGVKMVRGLPRNLRVENDAIFRVESKDGELRVAGDEVGELILLIRTVVRIEFYPELFGAARTRYLSIEDSRAPWDMIVGMAITE